MKNFNIKTINFCSYASSVFSRFCDDTKTFATPLSLIIVEEFVKKMVSENILKRYEKVPYGNRLKIDFIRLVPVYEARFVKKEISLVKFYFDCKFTDENKLVLESFILFLFQQYCCIGSTLAVSNDVIVVSLDVFAEQQKPVPIEAFEEECV